MGPVGRLDAEPKGPEQKKEVWAASTNTYNAPRRFCILELSPCWPCPSPSPPCPAPSRWDHLAHHPCRGNRPSGWRAKPPSPPRPVHGRHCPAGPLTLHSLECIPLRGATESWGALQRPPITQLQGKAGLEEHSESEHTLTRRLLCTGAAFTGGAPLPVQGSTAGVSGSALSQGSLHLPWGTPLKSWRETAARLPFRQVSFSPMSAPLQPGERGEACLYRPRVARPPPGLMGAQQEAVVERNRGRGHGACWLHLG